MWISFSLNSTFHGLIHIVNKVFNPRPARFFGNFSLLKQMALCYNSNRFGREVTHMSDITIHTSNPGGITCVSNVFIDTYMKEANGEYVKIEI